MSGGSLELRSSNFSITDENDDDSSKTDFVDAREYPEGINPKTQSSITTGSVTDLATEEKIGLKNYLGTVRAEEKVRFLGVQHKSNNGLQMAE